MAEQIATQAICPKTRESWSESVAVSLEGLPPRLSLSGQGGRAGRGGNRASGQGGRAGQGGNRASGRGGRARPGRTRTSGRAGGAGQGRQRPPPLGGAQGNNYNPSGGFGKLPPPDMDYMSWTVEQLREFLSVSKPRETYMYDMYINRTGVYCLTIFGPWRAVTVPRRVCNIIYYIYTTGLRFTATPGRERAVPGAPLHDVSWQSSPVLWPGTPRADVCGGRGTARWLDRPCAGR